MKPGDLDLGNPDSFADGFPHAYFAMLRREAPVSWNESARRTGGHGMQLERGFWVISCHADVIEVSRNPRLFSSAAGGAMLFDPDPQGLEMVRTMLITMDPPEHVKYRRLVQRGFTPQMVAKLEPHIREEARQIVDAVARRGSAEFVEDLAMNLPMILICELMGIPREDRRRVFDWSNRMIGFDDPDFSAALGGGDDPRVQMWLYSNQLAAQKRAHPDDTLMSKFVNGEVDGEKISELELNNFFLLLAIAGNETTRTATAQGMLALHRNPAQYALLRSDVERYLPGAIEEILRYTSPVMHFRRTVTAPTELGGVRLAAGDKVVMWYPSANRDESVFGPQADRFDITREPNPHLAFGIGEHYCLGANLARMQLACILRELLTRIPDLRVVEPPARLRSCLIDGIKSMRVEFTPEAA
jgi:cholest-4-en-3-one 26-monooxygenase